MLQFFDCDVGVGDTGLNYPRFRTPGELLAVLDRYAISDALVYDRGAHESGVFDRFEGILQFCAGQGRLHPTVAVLPPACGEQPQPDELVPLLLAKGVRAVRACPKAHNLLFDVFSMGRLLEQLQAHRIPVLHSSQGMQDHPWLHEPNWQNLQEVATAFPQLPIVVLYTGMLQGRRLLPLLERCPNVYCDLNGATFQFIEYVVERIGNRLVFASHLPTEDPALYCPPVNYAGVSPADRERIAAGNIRRLLEGVQ